MGTKLNSFTRYCKKGNWTSRECSSEWAWASSANRWQLWLATCASELSIGTEPSGVSHAPLDMIASGAPLPKWLGHRIMYEERAGSRR